MQQKQGKFKSMYSWINKQAAWLGVMVGLIVTLVAGQLAIAQPAVRDWTAQGQPVVKGYLLPQSKDDVVIVRQADGKDITLSFAKLAEVDQVFVLETRDPSKPAKLPEKWIDGYRVRLTLRVASDPAQIKSQSILATLPVGAWLNPAATDIVVQTRTGQVIPAYVVSHDPTGNTIIQFKRNADDLFYWVYVSSKTGAAGPAGAALPEGMTVEVRRWAGDNLSSWKDVAEGLGKSDNVIGNAIVPEIIQNANPICPDDPRNFASSYRGYLNVPKTGWYQVFLNSDDAAFLFVDGKLIAQNPGAKVRVTNNNVRYKFPKDANPGNHNYEIGTRVELTEGVRKFELHHVLGNNPGAIGYCVPLWIMSDKSTFGIPDRAFYASALIAQVVKVEPQAGTAATFDYGIDDSLSCNGVKLWIVDFKAQGAFTNPDQLVWDFGDGIQGKGANPSHVYLKDGAFSVTLKSGDGVPLMKRTVYVWTPPMITSPLSLGKAVRVIEAMDWKKLQPAQIKVIFEYLMVCEQATRWPLMEKVTTHLLTIPNEDPKLRAMLYAQLIQAMAYQQRAKEAVAMEDKVLTEFARLPSLALTVKMAFADIYATHLKDFSEASRRYEKMVDEYRRLQHPAVRQAAIRWGDLFIEAGELARAEEAYKLATKLGGQEFNSSETDDAITRGSLLRVAEQRLKTGDIRQTRTLLERIELSYPEQKLDGLYNYLRAETDRYAGRYESALQNYDIVLKLQNWAGFHDRALYGKADTYYRMFQYDEALKFLSLIESGYPVFFKAQKLDQVRKTIQGRIARADRDREMRSRMGAAAGAPAGPDPKKLTLEDLMFQGIANAFTATDDQKRPLGVASGFSLISGLGLHADVVGLCYALPTNYSRYFDYLVRLRNIESEGFFCVELWYRTEDFDAGRAQRTHTHFSLSSGTQGAQAPGTGTVAPERTFGTWRKLIVVLKAPITQDGQVTFSFRHAVGTLSLDGFSVMPISPREMDSYNNFIQGNTEE